MWEKSLKENGCVYMYNWITLLHRSYHNLIHQLYFNETSKMRKKEFLLWLSGLRTQPKPIRMWVWYVALLGGLRIWHCHRGNSDLLLLWLWCRLAAAPPIQPLAWEFPCAAGSALKRKKKKKRQPQETSQSLHLLMYMWEGVLLSVGQRSQISGTARQKEY